MTIEELIKILAPPTDSPLDSEVDWMDVISKYDINVPDDFKEIIDVYGSGCIDDFVWLLNPKSGNENINFDASNYLIDSYGAMKQDFPNEFRRSLFPQKGSFFPWALTDNGESFVWIVDGDPNSWSVAIHSKDQGQEEIFYMGALDFLGALLSKKISSSILPKQFPSANVGFEALKE